MKLMPNTIETNILLSLKHVIITQKNIYNTLTSKLGGKVESDLPMCQQWSFNKTKK
jgi:hypothetical protein